jgi:23S rRNA (uracil1939-C5)-methyltransferase
MTKKVVEEIIRHKPEELIIISCDPPTLARDTSRLIQEGYTPSGIHLVDLFPGTFHIETVIYFKKTE